MDRQLDIKFTGERFVPGKTSKKIEEDHLARYRFATRFALNKKVLDIACGVGYGSFHLATNGAKYVHGVDFSAEAIEQARQYYSAKNIIFMQGDISTFSQGSEHELIVCFETIEHVSEYKKAIENLYNLLGDGGILLISSPNRIITSPHCKNLADAPGGFHKQEFTIEELTSELNDAGFTVDEPVYGQRQQKYLPLRFLQWCYNSMYKPHKKFSAEVTPVTTLVPRYFVLVARK